MSGTEQATNLVLFERVVDIGDAVQRIEQALADAPSAHALRGALKVLSRDMHVASTRPCDTCRMVSAALGEPFGCSARAERVAAGIERLKQP